MELIHHELDIDPLINTKNAIFVNEPWIADKSMLYMESENKEPDSEEDNIRVFVPIDLNHKAIMRRLHCIIDFYEEANERNEINFSSDVEALKAQIEIYDQIFRARNIPDGSKHSIQAQELVEDFVKALESIPDGCAELFPFDMIEYLREEYLD